MGVCLLFPPKKRLGKWTLGQTPAAVLVSKVHCTMIQDIFSCQNQRLAAVHASINSPCPHNILSRQWTMLFLASLLLIGAPSINFAKGYYLLCSMEPPFIIGLPSASPHLTAIGHWPIFQWLATLLSGIHSSNFLEGIIYPLALWNPHLNCVSYWDKDRQSSHMIKVHDQLVRDHVSPPQGPNNNNNQTNTRRHYLAPYINVLTVSWHFNSAYWTRVHSPAK